MQISDSARSVIGILLITVPLVQFGGVFLLTQLGRRNGVIRSDLQASYFRAGHAHAGVFIILAIVAQLLIDVVAWQSSVGDIIRAGFFLPPIFIPAGFFLGAPTDESSSRGPLFVLIPIGAVILALATLALGVALLFPGSL
jgi:hypothetical protein